MNEDSAKVAALIERLPDSDTPGKESKLTGPAREEAAAIAAGILAGGKEAILELVDGIADGAGGGAGGYKPGYALRCLALHVGAAGRDAERRLFTEAVASRLGGDKPKEAQAFLIRELQLAGGPEAAGALARLLGDDDLCAPAAQALVAAGTGAAELRAAWGGAKGRRRVAIAQALGALRDAPAAASLREALADEDCDLRLTAAWALARIGDAGSAAALLKLAGGAAGVERAQATAACLLLAETLLAAGRRDEARGIYAHLRDGRQEPSEAHAREAAERGLAAAGG